MPCRKIAHAWKSHLRINDETDLHPTDPDNPEARWVEVDKVAELLTHQKDKDFFLGIIDGLR